MRPSLLSPLVAGILTLGGARDYNEESDPATCRGHAEAGTLEHVRAAFWG